jgi:tetratricopeptide (TPR) repeat protein
MKYLIVVFLLVLSCTTKSPEERFFETGQYEEAVEYYTNKIGSTGNDLSAFYNRGRAYEELGKFSEAISDFEYILEKDDRHLEAHLSLAKIAYQTGDYSKSVIYSGKALKFHKSSYQAHFLLARANHQMGYFKRALEGYNAAINLNSSYGEALLYRGAVKFSMEDKSACDDIKKAKELGVDEAEEAEKKYCR